MSGPARSAPKRASVSSRAGSSNPSSTDSSVSLSSSPSCPLSLAQQLRPLCMSKSVASSTIMLLWHLGSAMDVVDVHSPRKDPPSPIGEQALTPVLFDFCYLQDFLVVAGVQFLRSPSFSSLRNLAPMPSYTSLSGTPTVYSALRDAYCPTRRSNWGTLGKGKGLPLIPPSRRFSILRRMGPRSSEEVPLIAEHTGGCKPREQVGQGGRVGR